MTSDMADVEEYMASKDQAGLMLECREFEAPYAMARQTTPPPDIVITLTHIMTRMQAIAVVEPQAGKPIILERLEKFAEDREVYQWTETQRRPGLALWSTTSPAVTILDDLFELAEVPDLNREMARRKLKAMTASLRHYIFKMEERMYLRAKAEAMKGINGLQDTIKLAMANSTDGIQDTIKLSIKEEMQSFQQGNEKGTTKRTHEEAFSDPDSHSGEPSEPAQDGTQSTKGHPGLKSRLGWR
ncbi:uncharacterized protein TrAFT101_006587 [Trichoderma asperellum]|uniref:uncharacterized protein n=1 Tax=Trichoderma asperellum TaxID=101201 RepID=UPI00331826E7|nr:hypothetical protein TrAFT101_006587 [Trichoderma asperellum]